MAAKDDFLARLRREIPEVEPHEARRLAVAGAALVDVREQDEIAQGQPEGAVALGRGFLEMRIEEAVPDPGRTVLLLCGSGMRSLIAADGLRRLGYRDVRSVKGGFNRWKDEGLPFVVPRTLDAAARGRYARQMLLPEVGEAGQRRLRDARVLLVGAGGLGSPAALYLAAAGVGTLGIVDHDVVDLSNLQRQVLHTTAAVGTPKVESARSRVKALNEAVCVHTYAERLDSSNVESVFGGYDVIVDGSDNFPARYLINDACVKLGLPNVHGSVFRFDGQATVFWPAYGERRGPCYRCLYPQPPAPELAPSCNEAGVLGVLPGLVGMVLATETLKLLLNVGDPLVGRLLCVDALRAQFREFKVRPNPDCAYCAGHGEFPGYVDYEHFCAAAGA